MATARSVMMVVLFLCTGTLLPVTSHGGWVLKDKDGSTTYIEEGKIKHVEEDSEGAAVIIDYATGRVVLMDDARAAFAAGTMDEYCTIMKKVMSAFGEMEEAVGTGADNEQSAVDIVEDGGETIAGLETHKYRVMVDGELYEELWMTTDSALLADLGDTSRHRSFMECLEAVEGGVEGSEAYRTLMATGWELRSISYDFGASEYTIDTISVDRQPLGADFFTPPASATPMGFEEFFAAMGE